MKKTLAITALFTAFTFLTQAQGIQESQPYIEVTGTAEREIIPDEIYISVSLEERQEGKTKITIEDLEKTLKEKLVAKGVDLDHLYLADAQSNYIRVRWTKKDVMAKVHYILMVPNAEKLRASFDAFYEMEIKGARVSRVNHSQIQDLQKEIRVEAIKEAKEKADYLLGAIGEKTGKALIVQEVSSPLLRSTSNMKIRGARAEVEYKYIEGVQVQDHVIDFKKIHLEAQVYVKFGIQ